MANYDPPVSAHQGEADFGLETANELQNEIANEANAPESSDSLAMHVDESQVIDDLGSLFEILPEALRQKLERHPDKAKLVEIILDLGRRPEARFPGRAEYLSEDFITHEDLKHCVDRVGMFSGDNRAGIERTLHRISAMRNRAGNIIGLTCRVGRAIFGTVGMIRDLVETGQSILMLGRPGVGKTTALREIARVLADDFDKRVVIIDTSNEIAGDGDIPHAAIGRARRMQVAKPELQHQVMIEAVENHMPEVIVIDEIGTELEALASRTIAERGVQLIGTAHGNQIENLIKNPTLSDLVGGIQSVTLGDDEARRRSTQKTVLERKAPPTFEIAVEMMERQRWVVHESVAQTVDMLLRGKQPQPHVRSVDKNGKVEITHERPLPEKLKTKDMPGSQETNWRSSGRMRAVPLKGGPNLGEPLSKAATKIPGHSNLISLPKPTKPSRQTFSEMLDDSFNRLGLDHGANEAEYSDTDAADYGIYSAGANGEGVPLHIYPYAVSRHQMEQVIRSMELPVTITKDLGNADVVLALRSHLKNHSKLRAMAKNHEVPIHTIKSNTMPQIVRALQRLLNMDDPSKPEEIDLNLFSAKGSNDELEALEEARLAVEQIVLAKGQPVELLPRSPKVRKMQHELVEHYRLKSVSFGNEPNRRLRIYPA